jgi:NAD(P)-dependent dehydrogenase (short-subunit alcohol dehydrogenase family)
VQAGGNACAIRGNVADEGDAIAMFDAVESALGRIDVLVNNTGIVAPSMSLADMSVARLGSPHEYVDYAGSKGAIDTMTLGLAKELAAQGVRVNCVRPGLINTEIHASGGRPDRAAVLGAQTPAVASRDSA